jgi:hypothetical protein
MNRPFRYALVAHGVTPLAEYSIHGDDFTGIAVCMLDSVSPEKPRGLLRDGDFVLLSLTDLGSPRNVSDASSFTDPEPMSYVCVVEKQVSAQTGYGFLESLKQRWTQRYGSSGSQFGAWSKTEEFGQTEIATLLRLMSCEAEEELRQIRANLTRWETESLGELREGLAHTDQLLAMGDRAETIRESAVNFGRETRPGLLSTAECKWVLIGLAVVLVLAAVIVTLVVSL